MVSKEIETIAGDIQQFAKDNDLSLHPGRDILKWAELVAKGGGACPCVPGRDRCPCDSVMEDIKELGRCRCGLFCNDNYLEEYRRLVEEPKAKKRWRKKQGKTSL